MQWVWTAVLLAVAEAGMLVVFSPLSARRYERIYSRNDDYGKVILTEDGLSLESAIATTQPSLIIDLTESNRTNFQLQMVAASSSIRLCTIQDGEILPNPDLTTELSTFTALLNSFHWEIFNIIQSENTHESELSRKLQERFPLSQPFLLPSDFPPEQVDFFLGRLVKPRGLEYFVVLTDVNRAELVLKAAIRKRLYREGNLVILGSRCNRVSEEVLGELGGGLLAFTQYSRVPISPEDRTDLALSTLSSPTPPTQYLNLYNTDAAEYHLLGQCSHTGCNITGTLQFPGQTSSIPAQPNGSLLISLPTDSSGGNEDVTLIHTYGAVAAVAETNQRSDLLPGFRLINQTFYFGVVDFNPQLMVENAYKLGFNFGSAVFNGVDNRAIPALFALFASANLSIPVIGSESPYQGFSSTAIMPLFVRTIVSDAYSAAIYAQLMMVFRWKRCIVINEPGLGIEGFVASFIYACDLRGIEVINRNNTLLAENFTSTSIETDLDWFRPLIESKVRIVMIVSVSKDIIEKVVSSLYAAGARRGDIVIVAVAWLIDGIWEYMRGDHYKEYSELMPGAFISFPMSFLGREGKRVYHNLKRQYGVEPPSGMCLFYDSGMLVAHALDFLIENGEDAEDGFMVNSALRTTRFTGCTGVVYIDPDSNDRSQMDFLVQNLQYYAENDTWRLVPVLRYSPTSLTMITRLNDFQWPDGSSHTPTDTFEYDIDCPFHSRDLRSSAGGKWVMIGVSCGIVLFTSLVTLWIWKKWWSRSIAPLSGSAELSVSDVIVLGSIVVEFVQYITLCTASSGLITALQRLGESVTLDFKSLIELNNGMYWTLLNCVLLSCLLWTVFLVMFYLDLWRKLAGMCTTIEQLADFSLPIVGNLGFLPFISSLTDVFACDQTTGDQWTDAVLNKDCYQRCWVYPHLMYVVGACGALVLYVPTAVFCRPLWQEFQPALHVKTSPGFLMLKTIYQVTLIVLSKTVKRTWPFAHSIVYTAVSAVFTGLVIWQKPFNYARPNLWQCVLMAGIVWLGLLSCISAGVDNIGNLVLVALLLAGWGLLILIGIILQIRYFPSQLHRRKGRDVTLLFKFQLKRNAVDPRTISHSLTKVQPLDTFCPCPA